MKLLSRSQTVHAQSGTLYVTALLAWLHVRDNRDRQGLRFSRYRFGTIHPLRESTYTRTYTESQAKTYPILNRNAISEG